VINMLISGVYLIIIIGVLYFIVLPIIYIKKGLKANKNWKKIVPPVITMAITIIFMIIFTLAACVSPRYTVDIASGSEVKTYIANNTIYIDDIPSTLIRIFVFYNIPTWIMLLGYFMDRRKKNHRDNIEKMKILDL